MRKRLLALYPKAWRERYGAEMSALLDDTPSSLTTTLDLLRGALLAHLRPIAPSSPTVRVRGTIAQVLGCFILFCFLGVGFAKTTENFDLAEHLHPLLGIAHSVILVGAIVAVSALALAAVPLAVISLATAHRTREPTLLRLIAVLPAAIIAFAAAFSLLALWLSAHHHRPGPVGWLLLGLCALCAAAGGFCCWAAPRAIMRRIEIPRGALRFSVPAVSAVAVCMALVGAATGVFLLGIIINAPDLGASGNGPGQSISVTASVAVQFAGMLALSAVAAVSAARGLRAVRAL
jgi:hypothetical protein